MAVEIPVVVDIDGAFQQAAKNVGSAIKPLQRKISEETLKLNIVVGIDDQGEAVEWTFREIMQSGTKDMSVLRTAIDSVSRSLVDLAKDGNRTNFDNLLEAKVYMEDMVRAAQNSRLEIDGLAKTINGLNARMESARNTLNSTRINSAEWKAAVKDIQNVTNAMDRVQRKMAEMGTKAGSIDRINIKIRELTDRWDSMSRAQKFDKDGNLKASAQKVVDKYRQLTEEAARFGKSLEATARTAQVETSKIKKSIREVNTEMDGSNSRLMTLIKNSLRLVAIHSATRFVRNIREVTSEFELQRVALGSIIQDTERANSLFKEIKAAAVESPFEIKDLVTYTKQLSAYQIETDKLFSTTTKLADISAGLGVDMGRLILAFGQVRAAAVLRGQELRQFTEAGIPLVDKLAQKFQELNGRAVSTAEVFELISKRAVPFAMIEEIFDDLTSAGGAFYKMQEKQAETLLGQWNNLKDAVSIMYDEMGNTSVVRGAMEGLIKSARTIMQNWHEVADIIKYTAIQFGAVKVATLFIPTLTRSTKLLEKAELAEARAKQLSNAAHSSKILKASQNSLRAYTYYTIMAARATTSFGRAFNQLKALMLGNWMGVVVAVLGLVASRLIAARNEAQRLNKELEKISAEGAIKIDQSTRNFERLAKAAVSAADGSREQSNAVDELVRTYGDMLPPADKVIDKLREMNGNYKSLTDAIREKINVQLQEQKLDEITSEFSSKVGRKRDTLKNYLKSQGLSSEEISSIMEQLQSAVKDGLVGMEQDTETMAKSIEKIIYDYTGKYIKLTKSVYSTVAGTGQQVYQGERTTSQLKNFADLVNLYERMDSAIEDVRAEMEGSTGVIGRYSKEWSLLKAELSDFEGVGTTSYAKNESRIENTVQKSLEFIQKKFDEGGVDISGAIVNGMPDFSLLDKMVDELKNSSSKASLKSIINEFRAEYEKMIPGDQLVAATKSKLEDISETTGISMDKLRSYIKKADEDSEKYLKNLKEYIDSFRKDAKELQSTMDLFSPANTEANRKKVDEYNQMSDALQVLFDWLSKIITINSKSGGSYQQDPFIAQMQNRMKFMQDFKKGYDDLRKYISDSGALGEEMKIMEGRGRALGLDIAQQKRAAEDLSAWYQEMIDLVSTKLRAKGVSGVTVTDLLGFDTSKRSKDVQDFQKLLQSLWDAKTDFDTSEMKKNFEEDMTKMKDEIKRSETVRNFYNEILGITGDEDIATSLSVSVYGGIGSDFKENMQKELENAFTSVDPDKMTDELRAAFSKLDFQTILSNLDKFPKEWRSRLKEMANDNEKYNADWLRDVLKIYQKTKTYEERISEIRKRESQKRAEIEASTALTDEQKASLTQASIKKEGQEIAEVQVESLKNTYEWTKAFDDLDRVGNQTLKALRRNLEEFIEAQKEFLTPEQLKALTDALEKVRDTQEKRDPLSAIVSGGRRAALTAAAMRSKPGSDAYASAIEKIKKFNETASETEKIDLNHIEDAFRDANKTMEKGIEGVEEYVNAWKSVVDAVTKAFNLDEIPIVGETLEGISDALSFVASILPVIITLNGILNGTLMMNPFIAAAAGIVATIGAIVGLVKGLINAKIEKLNKKIEEQADLIETLEYQYGRLENAIAKAFGSDYVTNYNQQLENLAAQQEAYLKQAEAERSKGKKADEDKIKDYENSARDAADKILDMQSQLSEFFSGTDITSAAKDFANSWIEAYKEFGSTTIAMREKFQEMVQEMVEKSLAAKVMQQLLSPIFSEIDRLAQEGGELSVADIAAIAQMADQQIPAINDAMLTLMNTLTQAGYNLRSQPGQFTGIARNIANASEESITGLAAGINTQNFYLSYMPTISANVAAILMHLTGGTADTTGSTPITPTNSELVLAYMATLPNIDANLAELLFAFKSVISPKSAATNTHYIAVRN